MKTIKTILSIAGLALTTIAVGQLLKQSNESILFHTVAYNSVNMRLEHHLNDYHESIRSGDQFEAPMAARTYYAPMEADMAVEPWMTTAFETNYYEVEPFIESWMVSPFETNYYEEEPFIEPWMIEPFKSGNEVEVEDWMTSSWI
jgi:hypothetical protein